jgi:putative nucleotidyltransferase with HDIG domain
MARFDILNARVATRVVALFVVGALVPVVVMAALSFTAVSNQLEEQSEGRLRQFSVGASQMILARLASYRSWVQSAGALALAITPSEASAEGSPVGHISTLAPGVEGVALAVGTRVIPISGTVGSVPDLEPEDFAHLEAGGAVLKAGLPPVGGTSPALHLGVLADAENRAEGVLWARLSADSVWASAALLASDPAVWDFCVLGPDSSPFYCKRGPESHLAGDLAESASREGVSGVLELRIEEEDHFVAWREVYLKSVYAAPPWTVVVDEAGSSVREPVGSFAYNLPLALAIGLGLVVLLASILVRRTMEPLEKLAAATVRVAQHDLSTRVVVAGRDEFADLASSFNTMAERLSLQFRQIEAGRTIDRAVISATDTGEAAKALLRAVGQLVSDGPRAVLLLEADRDGAALVHHAGRQSRPGLHAVIRVGASQRPWLANGDQHLLVDAPEGVPEDFADCGVGDGGKPTLLVPLVVQNEPVGALAVEADGAAFTSDALERARQLADQAAVGFHELKLRRDLAEMSWEALRAFAAAIDAKSTWTAGHSERVTDLALELGRELGLDAGDMDTLHRGALLHDIGKIGVPVEIIDFAGPLDGPMREAMEAHPRIGARILEPIRVFQPILPIVLYHHERWDGSGYPEGLKGMEIPRLARILAVADVFDAMASARPYRHAAGIGSVVEYIQSESGRAYDPEPVEALGRVVAGGWIYRPGPPALGLSDLRPRGVGND